MGPRCITFVSTLLPIGFNKQALENQVHDRKTFFILFLNIIYKKLTERNERYI